MLNTLWKSFSNWRFTRLQLESKIGKAWLLGSMGIGGEVLFSPSPTLAGVVLINAINGLIVKK